MVSQSWRNRFDGFDYLIGIVDILMLDTLGNKDDLLRSCFQGVSCIRKKYNQITLANIDG